MHTLEKNIIDFYINQKQSLKQLRKSLIKFHLLDGEKDNNNNNINRLTYEKIIELVEDVFDTKVRANNRRQNTIFARKAAAYILKMNTTLSLKEISEYIGVKDHSTVLYNISTAKDLMFTEEWYKNKINEIEQEIKNYNIFVMN
jgi:chromosomal replication initiation ATPase DnaA